MDYERNTYYTPEQIFKAVDRKIKSVQRQGDHVDYLTFVPDGESTLDSNLGREIEMLKHFGMKQAIITNSSLMHREDVRNDLHQLDLVSVKVDSVLQETWKRIDRPHKMLELDKIKEGLVKFSKEYQGKLITETMLIEGVNDDQKNLEKTADFIAGMNPDTAYISIPTRPPARKDVKPASEEKINKAFQVFSQHIHQVEYLIGHEGNAFSHSGNTEQDILSITAVHPMRKDSIVEFLENDNKDWSVVEKLIKEGKILETEYGDHTFYVRKIANRQQV
jgi:wyosine [tRNA(Phe)-imidazoG37] synthetase (radical SAM superfamily)